MNDCKFNRGLWVNEKRWNCAALLRVEPELLGLSQVQKKKKQFYAFKSFKMWGGGQDISSCLERLKHISFRVQVILLSASQMDGQEI